MVTNLLDSIVGIGTDVFSLAELKGFPYEEYMENLSDYEEMERWITGEALDDTRSSDTGKEVDLYPLKINPLIATVLKHAYALFGEWEDDGRPLVVPKLVPKERNDQALETAGR
jgi:hypothetical protein